MSLLGSLLGNIIWLLFGGLISGLGYIIGGLSLCLTIVGIPFGLQQIKVGLATMTPFGKKVVTVENADSPLRVILNVIWVFFFGWAIALSHLIHGVILAITIIGLPFAKQHFKLVVMAVLPFGRELVDIDR
jgi:uncharacterized membrane protein YccF (DUF307 family)